jgi:hypothetical protein
VVDVDADEEAGTRALAKSATLLSSALLAKAPATVMARYDAGGFLNQQDGSGKLSEKARSAQGLRVLDKAAEGGGKGWTRLCDRAARDVRKRFPEASPKSVREVLEINYVMQKKKSDVNDLTPT